MDTVSWEPPDKGPWELEATHFCRPMSRFAQQPYHDGFARGFSAGLARFGLLLDQMRVEFVNGFTYMQPVAVGAPAGAMGPPPKPLLWLLARAHPALRSRIAESARAFEERRWRAELGQWDEVDKPAAIVKHRAIQAVDVGALSDVQLADHLDRCRDHIGEMTYLHHRYTMASVIAAADLVAGVTEWTDISSGEVLSALQGTSRISRGFAADELEAAGKAISASDTARALLSAAGSPESVLGGLRADPDAGPDVSAYLDAVRYRSVGYDPGDVNAGELPAMLVGTLCAVVSGTSASPRDDSRLDGLRARIPAAHAEDFEDRLAEACLVNRLRDERGAYSDGWGSGLARRALLEAGRRLHAQGKLAAPEHAVDLDARECRALLLGGGGPTADEVAERVRWRTTQTIDDAPPFLRAMPAPPPAVDVLPRAGRRPGSALNAVFDQIFSLPDTPNSDVVLHGLPVNTGTYEGTARVMNDSEDLDRIQQGDVLISRSTSPYFNVVLPLLGAIVTDRGGQLSHAAIVAREYGIPGIVGTRDATAKVADGARVRVDGTTGEVWLLT